MNHIDNISQLNDTIAGAKGLLLVKFGATWCNPCKQQNKILEEVSLNPDYNSVVEIVTIDIDNVDNSELAKFSVKTVPTLVLYRDGVEKTRLTGLQQSYKLYDLIDSNC